MWKGGEIVANDLMLTNFLHEGWLMMDCLSPMAPNDEELLKYALDEEPLPPGAMGHLELCSICQQRLTRYKQANKFLLVQLYRSQCPDATLLNHYCAGLLPGDENIRLASHIRDCPLCTDDVANIRRLLNNFDPFPPPSLVVQRILANLVPWQPQLVMRGESAPPEQTAWPRQYRTEAINISLHLSRASNGEMMLLGLFSYTDPEESVEELEGVQVELYSMLGNAEQGAPEDGHLVMSTEIDDMGSITFKGVPVGEYVLIVRMPNHEVAIEKLGIEYG